MIINRPKTAQSTLKSANRDLEEKQVQKVARQKNIPYVNLSKIIINPDVLHILPKENAIDGQCFAFFKTGNKIRLGVVDQTNERTLLTIHQLSSKGFDIQVNLISRSSLEDALLQYANVKEKPQEVIENEISEEQLKSKDIEFMSDIDDKKTFEITNEIFVKALSSHASDIHLEPSDKTGVIRFRVDGVLVQISSMPKDLFGQVVMQVKHLANLKLNVTNRPQDGRAFFIINKEKIDVRVSSLPTQHGEDIVMRILDSRNKHIGIDGLDLFGTAKDHIQKSMSTPTGMILVTGPTGSGKTTTLYSLLTELNSGKEKIITLEDPIEYKIEGITQSQIDEDKGYDFATGLRNIVRQDPDIIMVGEIRDHKTALTACQAALTGHKVLSTLHTNSACATIPRLINMGVEPFMLAPAIDIIISQRLVRKLHIDNCETKSIPQEMKAKLRDTLDNMSTITHQEYQMPESLPFPTHTQMGENSSYQGRMALFEVLKVDDHIRSMILEGKSEKDIEDYARSEGMLTLFEYGLIKVLEAKTSAEEVWRVSGE